MLLRQRIPRLNPVQYQVHAANPQHRRVKIKPLRHLPVKIRSTRGEFD